MKTIVIVGAGLGLGLSIAKKFGTNGFRVALISRNHEKLSKMMKELGALHIEAHAFVADVTDLAALRGAIQAVKKEVGSIDVLEFSPYGGWGTFTHVLETTPESVLEQMSSYLLPAVLSVNEVLPEMIQNGAGAILFTTGISAMAPLPIVGNGGVMMSGIRNYATNLYNELKAKGVFVGHLSIGTMIQAGTVGDPDVIASAWFNLFEKKDHFEEVFPEEFNPTKFAH